MTTTSVRQKSRQVHLLTNYITTMGNPFMSGDRLINIVTQNEIPLSQTEYLLDCLPFGERLIQDFNRE